MAEGVGPAEELVDQVVVDAMIQSLDALRRQEWRRALAILEAVPGDAEAAPAPLVARAHAWRAQAAMNLGRYAAATASLRQALRLLRAQGDEQGLATLATLQKDLFARRAAVSAQGPLPDTPLGRALAAMDAGDWEQGESLARAAAEAADAAGDPKERVMARLALARVPGRAEAAIREAARIADESDDRNLVTAVARAARAADVTLAPHVF